MLLLLAHGSRWQRAFHPVALSLSPSLSFSVVVFKKEGRMEGGLKKIPGERCHCSFACGSYNVELLPQYAAFSEEFYNDNQTYDITQFECGKSS